MYIYELKYIICNQVFQKNVQAVSIYLSIYNLMNQQLNLPTLSFVTRYTTIPSLLILIFVGYPWPDYGMHYQS